MTINWWTIGIQSVNVGILVWLLSRFFWTPLAAMIETRRATAAQILVDATTIRDQAATALAQIETTRAGFSTERDRILAESHKEAATASAMRLASAATDVATLQAAGQALLDKDRKAADVACANRATQLALDIATRLAGRLVGPSVDAAFLDWLLKAIRALPAATRQAVMESKSPLEAISTGLIGPADQDRYSRLIDDAFGGRVSLGFVADPALVCGLELRGPNLILRNSWRADLAQIQTELTHDSGR